MVLKCFQRDVQQDVCHCRCCATLSWTAPYRKATWNNSNWMKAHVTWSVLICNNLVWFWTWDWAAQKCSKLLCFSVAELGQWARHCLRCSANIAAQPCEATLLRPTLWKEFQTVLNHMDRLVWITKFELPKLICYALNECRTVRLKQGLFLCTGCIRYLTRLFASAWQNSSVDVARFVIIIVWHGSDTLRTWVGNRIESRTGDLLPTKTLTMSELTIQFGVAGFKAPFRFHRC